MVFYTNFGLSRLLVAGLIFLSACGRGNDNNEYHPDVTTPPAIQQSAPAEPSIEYPATTEGDIFPYPYIIEPIIVGYGGQWPLNGLLTIPHMATPQNPVPAAVLVQGSGAANMNLAIVWEGEAINRPFFDVATHLSNNGVAVIRNDKRGYAHADTLMALAAQDITAFGSHTVWEEAIEDALLAAELLLADPRIDSERIYLIGLSLGAVLSPRIQLAAQERGFDFAGLVLMAGTPRCLVEVTLMQINDNTYAAWAEMEALEPNTDPSITEAFEAELVEAQAMLDLLTRYAPMIWDTPPEEARGMFWFGGSFYYFQDLANPTFEEAVARIDTRMLVMQGARDFQVRADTCFVEIQRILSSRENVIFNLYDDLNHLFMQSVATNHLEHGREIISPGRMDTQVLQDITAWIHGR
ncbi:MAG: alpha/beta fold hydrolase [Defluviitaleaceae bacterium]|nr:alpha/beta fold hydrolase [Defluviitaleaceae bacterium]